MGIDISLYAERRVERSWLLAEPMESNPERQRADEWAEEVGPWLQMLDEQQGTEMEHELLQARSISPRRPRNRYERRCRRSALWCILGYGNGRQHSLAPYEPIAPARGLPEDLSPELRDWATYDVDEHSYPSWLTLGELLRFDWHGRTIVKTAMVDPRVAHLFRTDASLNPRIGFPLEEWPKDVPVSYSLYKRG